MGWCSATIIFDDLASFIVELSDADADMYIDLDKGKAVLKRLAIALEDNDWDCQSDSDYWDHPVVVEIFKELHPDWDWTGGGITDANG